MNPTLTIKISGKVEKFATIKPFIARLDGFIGEDIKTIVTIVQTKKYPFKIKEVKALKGEYIDYKIETKAVDGTTQHQLLVTNKRLTKGMYNDTIEILTDNKEKPKLSIRVYGNIMEKQKAEANKSDS